MLVGKTLRKRFHVDKELSLAKLEASIYIAAERLEGRAFLQNYAETSYSVRASKQLRLQYLYCLSRKMEKHSHLKNIADQIQDVLGEALMPDFKFDDTKLQLIFS